MRKQTHDLGFGLILKKVLHFDSKGEYQRNRQALLYMCGYDWSFNFKIYLNYVHYASILCVRLYLIRPVTYSKLIQSLFNKI